MFKFDKLAKTWTFDMNNFIFRNLSNIVYIYDICIFQTATAAQIKHQDNCAEGAKTFSFKIHKLIKLVKKLFLWRWIRRRQSVKFRVPNLNLTHLRIGVSKKKEMKLASWQKWEYIKCWKIYCSQIFFRPKITHFLYSFLLFSMKWPQGHENFLSFP